MWKYLACALKKAQKEQLGLGNMQASYFVVVGLDMEHRLDEDQRWGNFPDRKPLARRIGT